MPTTPLSGDDVNDILQQPPTLDLGGMPEGPAEEVHALARAMLKAVGLEAYKAALLKMALPHAAKIRERIPAEHPLNIMLDEYHAKIDI